MKKLFLLALMLLLSVVSYAQYEHFYMVSDDTYIITSPNALLYELPDSYSGTILNSENSLVSGYRDFIDTRNLKNKKIKKTQKLRVLRYTNTSKNRDFNAYIVEYKDKLWVLEGSYVQDNTHINTRNTMMSQDKQEKELRRQFIVNQLDSLNRQLDDLVTKFTLESTDSLNYYKELKTRLPLIRNSLIESATIQEQEKVEKEYNKWYNAQPTTTKNAVNIIQITHAQLETPNSAGGCDYILYYKNNSTKTIKYLYWTGTVYNAVNDLAYCEVRNTATYTGKDTGPIAQGDSGGGVWSNIVYNYSADTLKLNNINIIYMNGSSASIAAADIRRLLKAPSKNVYVNTSEIQKSVMSDEVCQMHIYLWQDRLQLLKNRKLSQIPDDGLNDKTWVLLEDLESQIRNRQTDENFAKLEVEKFDKFLNFEKY